MNGRRRGGKNMESDRAVNRPVPSFCARNRNKSILLIFIVAEIITAVIYAYGMAPDLAAMHDDSQVYLPILLLFVSAYFLIFLIGFLSGFAVIRRQHIWQPFCPVLEILLSVILWACILCVIGYNTDCF